MGPVILSGLIKLLDTLAEEKSMSSYPSIIFKLKILFAGKEANELKSFTYNAVGLLGKRVKVRRLIVP